MKSLKLLSSLIFVMALAGCGTFEIRIEATPTPQTSVFRHSDTPEANRSTTTVPAQITITPTLTPAPASNFPTAGLVYRDGDKLFRVGPDGQPVPMAPNLDPAILPGQFTPRAVVSPDGSQMISWWDFSDLWLIDLKTGRVLNLTHTPDRLECCAQFWPANPDTIVFMSKRADSDGQSFDFPALIKLDGSGYQLLDESSPSLGLPAPAPDGRQIAFDRAGEPWLYHLDSGLEPFNPAGYGLQTPASNYKLASPAWSPDGKLLAWIASGDIESKGYPIITPIIFNRESKKYLLVDKYQSAGSEGWQVAPVWSTDGAWLAFTDFSSEQFGMWVIGSDGTNVKKLYQPANVRSTSGLQAFWSPVTSQLMISDPNAEGGPRTLLVDPDSGQTQTVPLSGIAFPIAWPRP